DHGALQEGRLGAHPLAGPVRGEEEGVLVGGDEVEGGPGAGDAAVVDAEVPTDAEEARPRVVTPVGALDGDRQSSGQDEIGLLDGELPGREIHGVARREEVPELFELVEEDVPEVPGEARQAEARVADDLRAVGADGAGAPRLPLAG